MSGMTTTTPKSIVNAKIADRKAAARREIAELRESIADPQTRDSFLNNFTGALQREVAFLSALEEIEFSFASIDDQNSDPQAALVQKLVLLVNFQGDTARNNNTTKDIIEGRVAAAKSIARTIADVSRDLSRGAPL